MKIIQIVHDERDIECHVSLRTTTSSDRRQCADTVSSLLRLVHVQFNNLVN